MTPHPRVQRRRISTLRAVNAPRWLSALALVAVAAFAAGDNLRLPGDAEADWRPDPAVVPVHVPSVAAMTDAKATSPVERADPPPALQVVDGLGLPVADARVCFSDHHGNYCLQRTDEHGRTQIPERFNGCEDCEILAVAPGLAAAMARLDLTQTDAPRTLQLANGSSLALTVTDEAGHPLADHRVRVVGEDAGANRAFEANLAAERIPLGDGRRDDIDFGTGPWKNTDDSGLVHFDGLCRGHAAVTVWRGDEVVLQTNFDLDRPFCTRRAIVLARRLLEVHVHDGATPQVGATAWLIAERPGNPDSAEILAHGTTDSAGIAVFAEVAIAAEVTVWACAGHDGRWGRSAAVAGSADDSILDVPIPTARAARRIVFIDHQGMPVRPASMVVRAERMQSLFQHPVDLAGRTEIECPVTFEGEALLVSATLGAADDADLFPNAAAVLMPDENLAVVEFRTRRNGERVGSVAIALPTVADGESVRVELRGHRYQFGSAVRVAGGLAQVAGVREGSTHVAVSTADGRVGQAMANITPNSQSRIDVALSAGATVRFSFADERKVDLVWQLVTGERDRAADRVTIARGTGQTNRLLECRGVPPGDYYLVVQPRQANSPDMFHMPFTVADGEVLEMPGLPLEAFGPQLSVELPDDPRISRVWLRGGLDRGIALRAILPTARLRFRGLLPATYELIATDETGRVLAVGKTDLAADDGVVLLRPR